MVPLNASHLMVILKSRGEDRKYTFATSGQIVHSVCPGNSELLFLF